MLLVYICANYVCTGIYIPNIHVLRHHENANVFRARLVRDYVLRAKTVQGKGFSTLKSARIKGFPGWHEICSVVISTLIVESYGGFFSRVGGVVPCQE